MTMSKSYSLLSSISNYSPVSRSLLFTTYEIQSSSHSLFISCSSLSCSSLFINLWLLPIIISISNDRLTLASLFILLSVNLSHNLFLLCHYSHLLKISCSLQCCSSQCCSSQC